MKMKSFASACIEFVIVLVVVLLCFLLFHFVAEQYELKDDFEDFV